MPIRMRANRRLYDPVLKREYDKGEEFDVQTQKDADLLVRVKRATRVELPKHDEPAAAPAPQKRYERRDMRPKGE